MRSWLPSSWLTENARGALLLSMTNSVLIAELIEVSCLFNLSGLDGQK
jgi:hypothetical protein